MIIVGSVLMSVGLVGGALNWTRANEAGASGLWTWVLLIGGAGLLAVALIVGGLTYGREGK